MHQLELMLQSGKGLVGPFLQVGIVVALGKRGQLGAGH